MVFKQKRTGTYYRYGRVRSNVLKRRPGKRPVKLLALAVAILLCTGGGITYAVTSVDVHHNTVPTTHAAKTAAVSRPVQATPATTPTPAATPTQTTTTTAKPVTASQPKPATASAPQTACSSNTDAKLLLISINQQHLWACTGTTVSYESAVTTGAYQITGDATPTGTWHIFGKQTNIHLTGPGYDYPVQYWMPFYQDYGFHDSSWQTFPYGSPQYATDGSHGCVHLPADTATWVYNWAPVGTTVTIQQS